MSDPFKKSFALLIVTLVATIASVFAASNDSHPDPVVARFGAALGYPDGSTIDAIKKDLAAEWIGKSSVNVEGWIRQVIHNRGTLGAVQGSGGGFLALSYWSVLLNKDTASLSIRFFYDDTGNVARIECTFKT